MSARETFAAKVVFVVVLVVLATAVMHVAADNLNTQLAGPFVAATG